jgi:hypothetical protein
MPNVAIKGVQTLQHVLDSKSMVSHIQLLLFNTTASISVVSFLYPSILQSPVIRKRDSGCVKSSGALQSNNGTPFVSQGSSTLTILTYLFIFTIRAVAIPGQTKSCHEFGNKTESYC